MTSERRERAIRAALGAIAWALAFVAADRLGLITAFGVTRLLDLDEGWLLWIAAASGAAIALGRARAVVPAIAAAIAILYVTVAFTPILSPIVRPWVLRERPRAADAIVVLSSDVTDEGRLSSNGVTRWLAGLELARAGHAPLLVRTDISPPRPDDTADARAIATGTDVEIALVGPVASTRDEALAVARLAAERDLHRVIVVTQPIHERRAAAAFRAAGLEVIAASSPERNYSLPALASSSDRIAAFRDLVTEIAAYVLYALRGWV